MIAIAVGATFVARLQVARARDATRQFWQAFARKVGGAVRYRDGAPELSVTLGGVRLHVDTKPVGEVFAMRVRARFLVPGGCAFSIVPERMAETLGKAFGTIEDVAIGDPVLDEHLVFRCADAVELRRILTNEARRLLRDLVYRWSVASDGETLTVVRTSPGIDGMWLERAIQLAAVIAGDGWSVLESIAAGIPNATLVPPAGAWDARGEPHVRVNGDIVVRIDVLAKQAHREVSVVSRSVRPIPSFRASVLDDGKLDGDVPPGVISNRAMSSLASLGRATLVADTSPLGTEVRVFLSPFSPHLADRARAAVALVDELCETAVHRGAFR